MDVFPADPNHPVDSSSLQAQLRTLQIIQNQIWKPLAAVYQAGNPAVPHPFQIGDSVYIRRHQSKTLEPHWKGPYTELLTTPSALNVDGIAAWVHASHAKKANTSENWSHLLPKDYRFTEGQHGTLTAISEYPSWQRNGATSSGRECGELGTAASFLRAPIASGAQEQLRSKSCGPQEPEPSQRGPAHQRPHSDSSSANEAMAVSSTPPDPCSPGPDYAPEVGGRGMEGRMVATRRPRLALRALCSLRRRICTEHSAFAGRDPHG
ncbi:hypothetical protein NN561_017149 [Cricetulus griseus]